MNSNNIAQEIIILRSSKGWTQQQLADELKTTQRTVAAWESGSSLPRNKMRVLLAKVFSLPENYFLADGEEEDFIDEDNQIDDFMQKFDKLLADSKYGVSDEKKKMCLNSCYKILSAENDNK